MTEPREKQIAEAVDVLQKARDMGWAKVSIDVTRGGTFRVQVEDAGGKVQRPQFGTGLHR